MSAVDVFNKKAFDDYFAAHISSIGHIHIYIYIYRYIDKYKNKINT